MLSVPATFEKVFIAGGRLRSAWRFLLSIPGVFVAFSATQVVLQALPENLKARYPGLLSFFLPHLLLLLGLLAVFKVMTTFCDRRPLGSVGLAFHRRWARDLGLGAMLGAIMILAVAALEWVLRLAHFRVNSLSPGQALSGGTLYILALATAATYEELVFRGYPFQRLVEAITPAGGIVVSSAVFGLVHLGNPYYTWISTANTALVGIALSIAYLRTRSLWMPVGIHFGWNFVLGIVIGLPVSGYAFPETLLQAQVRGAVWLTGAAYGPEGSVLATMAIVGATIYLLLSKRIYVSEEMRELLMGPSPTAPSSNTPGALGATVEHAPENQGRRA